MVAIDFHDIREHADDTHNSTDDTPYGGGPGMIFKVEPVYRCLEKVVGKEELEIRFKKQGLRIKNKEARIQKDEAVCAQQTTAQKTRIILMSPGGARFTQAKARRLAKNNRIVLICGRYEGVDARVRNFIDEEISIGPFVLSGGELPAMVVVEAVARLVPGVLGSAESLLVESYAPDKKNAASLPMSRQRQEYPQYTRPEAFEPMQGISWRVPEVLLSGDHKKIAQWRLDNMR